MTDAPAPRSSGRAWIYRNRTARQAYRIRPEKQKDQYHPTHVSSFSLGHTTCERPEDATVCPLLVLLLRLIAWRPPNYLWILHTMDTASRPTCGSANPRKNREL